MIKHTFDLMPKDRKPHKPRIISLLLSYPLCFFGICGFAMGVDKNSGETAKRPRYPSLYRFIQALSPLPYLIKARDYYIKIMTECAGRATYSGMEFAAPGAVVSLPKSFSTASSRNEEDYKELVRAASQRSAVSR